MDYGVPGDAKYTLGGWQSATGDSHAFEDGRARLVPGKLARLALPADSDAAARLSLRVRGFAQGPLTVHANGETLADLALDGSGFQIFELPVAPGVLSRGENALQLRVARTGSAPGVAGAGLAIDWVQRPAQRGQKVRLAHAAGPAQKDHPRPPRLLRLVMLALEQRELDFAPVDRRRRLDHRQPTLFLRHTAPSKPTLESHRSLSWRLSNGRATADRGLAVRLGRKTQ
jgi:hypothetical protein